VAIASPTSGPTKVNMEALARTPAAMLKIFRFRVTLLDETPAGVGVFLLPQAVFG
jgi:hypothetical protein